MSIPLEPRRVAPSGNAAAKHQKIGCSVGNLFNMAGMSFDTRSCTSTEFSPSSIICGQVASSLSLYACKTAAHLVCGCAGAAPPQSRQQGGVAEDSGYWDLVYLLYPEAVEAAGLGLVHELVSSWPLIERTLAVNN